MDGLRPSSVLLSMTMVWLVASLCRMYIFRGALAVKDDDSTVLSQSSISPSDEPLAAWLAVEDERGMVPPLRKRLRQACLPDRLRTSPARVPGDRESLPCQRLLSLTCGEGGVDRGVVQLGEQ